MIVFSPVKVFSILYITTLAFGHPFYNRRGVLVRPHGCANKEKQECRNVVADGIPAITYSNSQKNNGPRETREPLPVFQ